MRFFGLRIVSEKEYRKYKNDSWKKDLWYEMYRSVWNKNKKLENEIANLKLSNNIKEIGNSDLNC